LTQLLKGTLDMCLLATIAQRPCYGYEMVQRLAQQGLALVSEGSIYPLLPKGAEQLAEWQAEWDSFAQAVSQILKGAHADGDPRSAHPQPDLRPQ
jgi:PadR family transcriptional regulator PadR